MKYLNYDIVDLEANQGILTAKEISSQPDLWIKTYNKLVKEKENLTAFLNEALSNKNLNIILTGAGSSAFIGETLKWIFQKKSGVPARAIPTTDIITHAETIFVRSTPTLLISFARSGDSPESVATIDLARKYCDDLYELIITCNADGKLASMEKTEKSYVFILPEESNDKALAMTGSYTSMLLVGILISDINNLEQKASIIRDIQSSGGYILENSLNKLRELARTKIDRVVFLGSGPLLGVAEESHLKVQELTCGKVICKFDSFLGFRHGPIAVVDTSTIVFSLLSKDPYVRQYEVDLIRSLKETAPGPLYVCIGDICDSDNSDHGLTIRFLDKTRNIPDEYLSVLYVLPAQILGFYKSLYLNLSPDFPSKNGMITRVVEGVKIYSRSVEV